MSAETKQTREESQAESLKKTGASALSCLRDMIAALDCDYDRLEELREERSDYKADGKNESRWEDMYSDEAEELKDLEESAGDCTSREDAEQRIQEDPLEILVRSGWESSKDNFTADEFKILLTTGGPAVRIIGELRDGEPCRAWLEVQDWGTPWTEYYETGMAYTCLAYARCFCFE